MAVKIRIADVLLESDSNGWKVATILRKGPEAKVPGEEYTDRQSYFASLEQALFAMQDRFLQGSDAESIEELYQLIMEFRAHILPHFRLEIRA